MMPESSLGTTVRSVFMMMPSPSSALSLCAGGVKMIIDGILTKGHIYRIIASHCHQLSLSILALVVLLKWTKRRSTAM